jgi:adenylate cyclase
LTSTFEQAGLYDPAAPDATARLDLLQHLAARGATVENMLEADARGQLVTAAADLSMFDIGNALSLEEVADRCGVSPDRVLRLRLASGLPVEEGALFPEWLPEDIGGFELGSALFGDAPTMAFSRVMGASAARVAEAAVALFLTEVNTQLTESDASPLEWAIANEEGAALVGVVMSLVSHLVREHLPLAIRRQRSTFAPGVGPESVLAIGFVDLAGSTEWAESLSVREQADALALFESAAWDIATRLGGRIVKLIGDEVMFATSGPAAACRIALDLCAVVDGEPSLPRARGAVGYGLVWARDGDYYGSMVNLISRSVKAAEEGAVVVTAEVVEQCEAEGAPLQVTELGPLRLRGIERPVPLFVAHR